MKEQAKTEAEMRDAEVTLPRTFEELNSYINSLVEREHNYSTCVYAVSMASEAAFNYVASKLRITGWGLKSGFRIINYEHLLYPQYLNSEHFPTHAELLEENKEELSKQAKILIATAHGSIDPEVMARWKYVASLGEDGEK